MESRDGSPEKSGLPTIRLDQVLVMVAFALIAGLFAIAADFWVRSLMDEPMAQAAELGETVHNPTNSSAPMGASAATAMPEATASPAAGDAVIASAIPVATDALAATDVVTAPVTPPACVPPADWAIHIVQQGNTLYSLAIRYGTDVETMMWVNCLNTSTIFIGQRLYVPGASPPSPTPVETIDPDQTSAPVGVAASATTTDIPATATSTTVIAAITSTPGPVMTATAQDTATAIPTVPTTPTPESAFRVDIPDRYLNIVLLGSDRRPRGGAWRTDSMIIVSVDKETDVVRLLSIPRDLWVYIPGHGNNRINTADLWGELSRKGSGPERVKRTIHHNLGIPIHYYVRIDFQGFMKIIDTVGGVDIDVDCPLPDINLTAGMHHMNGREALRYSRSRKSTNDFDRGRRQRKVLMSLWEQALSLDIIPKLPSLWKTMSDSFQTDLPLDQVINLAYIGTKLKPQRILSKAIGAKQVTNWYTPEGAAVLLPNHERIRTLLAGFYAPKDVDNLDQTAGVRIEILNGSQQSQAARLAATNLRWEGFKIASTGVADRRDYYQSRVLIYNGDVAMGEELAGALKLPPSAVQIPTEDSELPEPSKSVDVLIILGHDYSPCQR